MEGLHLVAMNVRTWVLDLTRLDDLDAAEALRGWSKIHLEMYPRDAGCVPCEY